LVTALYEDYGSGVQVINECAMHAGLICEGKWVLNWIEYDKQ